MTQQHIADGLVKMELTRACKLREVDAVRQIEYNWDGCTVLMNAAPTVSTTNMHRERQGEHFQYSNRMMTSQYPARTVNSVMYSTFVPSFT
jgi:hypothetical protein